MRGFRLSLATLGVLGLVVAGLFVGPSGAEAPADDPFAQPQRVQRVRGGLFAPLAAEGGAAAGRGGAANPGEAPAADPFAEAPPSQRAGGERPQPAAAGYSGPASFYRDPDEQAHRRIHRILEAPLTSAGLDLAETPLEEVVQFLRDEYELEVQLDANALDDLGISPEDQVTANLRNVRLGAALQRVLEPLGLTAITTQGVLLITTEEEAETRLETRVYPVADLLMFPTISNERRFEPLEEFEPLIDTILSCVASDTWAEHGGGEAQVRPLRPGMLTISATQRVHGEVEGLLASLREAKRTAEATLEADPVLSKLRSSALRRESKPEPTGEAAGGFGGGGAF